MPDICTETVKQICIKIPRKTKKRSLKLQIIEITDKKTASYIAMFDGT